MADKTVPVTAGVNAISCVHCEFLNKRFGHSAYFGTLFVPVTMEKMAELHSGHQEHRTALCHDMGHKSTVLIRA